MSCVQLLNEIRDAVAFRNELINQRSNHALGALLSIVIEVEKEIDDVHFVAEQLVLKHMAYCFIGHNGFYRRQLQAL